MTFNGQVYNMPFGGGTLGLVYRSSVLTQYHLPVPTTWATFASDAEALHKDNPNEYMTYFPNNDGEYVLSLLQQAGANPFTDNNGNWTIDLDSPAAQKVMTYWGNLIKQGDIAVQADFARAWQHSIATGQYATYLGPDWFPSAVLVPYIKAGSESFTVTTVPQWSRRGRDGEQRRFGLLGHFAVAEQAGGRAVCRLHGPRRRQHLNCSGQPPHCLQPRTVPGVHHVEGRPDGIHPESRTRFARTSSPTSAPTSRLARGPPS